MLTNKLTSKILKHVLKSRGLSATSPICLTLALTIAFPVNLAFAEENDTLVSPEQTNVSDLDYLVLSDYFVTAAERIPTHKMDTPAKVTVITAEEIEANHYQTVAEALSHVNGVIIYNAGVSNSFVIMNGNTRVLLLIDGYRANNTQEGFSSRKSNLSMIPSIKMIERIEIVKCGSSALYGTDAVGGIVNIVTKKEQINETSIDLNMGSWNKYNYEITNQGVINNFSWFLTGSLGKSRAYKYKGSGNDLLSDHSDYSNDAMSLRIDNRIDKYSSVTATLMHRTQYYNNYINSALHNSFAVSYNFKEDTATPIWIRYFNIYKALY